MSPAHKVIVHIGLPKTATTVLQTSIFPALDRQAYEYLGVCQPRGRVSQSAAFKAVYAAVVHRQQVESAKAMLTEISSTRSVFISEEIFTSTTVESSWKHKVINLSDLLSGFDAEILVTVREPAVAMFSYFVEMHRSPFVNAARGFRDSCQMEFLKIYKYREFFEFLEYHFGGKFVVESFEQVTSGGDNLLVSRYGLDPRLFADLPVHNAQKKQNFTTSPGYDSTAHAAMSRLFYRAGMGNSRFLVGAKKALRPYLTWLDSIPLREPSIPVPSDAELEEVRESLRADNDYLFRRFGIRYSPR
jgi:hypothetical protein